MVGHRAPGAAELHLTGGAIGQGPPGSADWALLTPLLAARRLNSVAGDAQPERWADESRVLTLTPDGTLEPVAR